MVIRKGRFKINLLKTRVKSEKIENKIRRVKIMESTAMFPRDNTMIVLKGDRIEEFIEKSRTGASKRAVEKFKRLEAKRKNFGK